MTPDQIKRKLAAILSADVQGYSRLMEGDEEGGRHGKQQNGGINQPLKNDDLRRFLNASRR
jgi:hypothetical protein